MLDSRLRVRSASYQKHLKKYRFIRISTLLLLYILLISCGFQARNKTKLTTSTSEIKIKIESLPVEFAPLFKKNFSKRLLVIVREQILRQLLFMGHGKEAYHKCKIPIIDKYTSIASFRIYRGISNQTNAF